jgi:hypothetical protein
LFGRLNLGLHPGTLVTESIGRYVVALFDVQPQQAGLLGLELGD